GDLRTSVDAAITDERLTGLSVDTVPRIAVADSGGVTLISPANGSVLQTLHLDGGAQGLALVEVDDPKLYVTTNPAAGPQIAIASSCSPSARMARRRPSMWVPMPSPGGCRVSSPAPSWPGCSTS